MTNSEPDLDESNLPFLNVLDTDLTPTTAEFQDLDKHVDLDHLGTNFQILEPSLEKKPAKLKRVSRTSKFIKGKSRHIFYVIHPEIRKFEAKKTTPINVGSKVNSSDRAKWNSQVIRNIKRTTTFLVEELLPVTAALTSAIADSQERFNQLVDDDQSRLPLAFILKKATLATQLKIIGHIADIMQLSAEDRGIMKAEFSRTLNSFTAKPTEVPNGRHKPKD